MNQRDFENLINRVKGTPLPECPGTIEQNVLRRLRLARHDTTQSRFDWVLGMLPQPGVILIAVVVSVTVSSGITIAANLPQPVVQERNILVSKTLGFDVFQSKEILNLNEH